MLKILHQKNHDPFFNIATEEYLLKHKQDDFFVIYRNAPSVIVGKHQNTNAEINHQFVRANQIPVVRRLSGGGTVYHDLGNVNFTFIMNGVEGQLVDFRKYTEPIIEILGGFGVEAYLGEKNDIRVDGKKISGNAEHIYKNRVLHHGTLLFQSDLDKLNEVISVDLSKYHDKAVKSVRSTVANIADFLSNPIDINFFEEFVVGYMLSSFEDSVAVELTDSDTLTINDLVKSKYSTWDWTYGYSPTYEVDSYVDCKFGKLQIVVNVSKGFIDDLRIGDGSIAHPAITKLRSLLLGKRHERSIVDLALADKEIGDFFKNHLSLKLVPDYFC
ncbi:MAG: lipoate--protein ligase [Bacteroidales bacterium]